MHFWRWSTGLHEVNNETMRNICLMQSLSSCTVCATLSAQLVFVQIGHRFFFFEHDYFLKSPTLTPLKHLKAFLILIKCMNTESHSTVQGLCPKCAKWIGKHQSLILRVSPTLGCRNRKKKLLHHNVLIGMRAFMAPLTLKKHNKKKQALFVWFSFNIEPMCPKDLLSEPQL